MNRPKKVSMFPVARPAESERYKPQRTLNSELAELYQQSGERGIVINRAQRIALAAIMPTYDRVVMREEDEDFRKFAMLTAVACFGASYYLFAEHSRGDVMNKRVFLPKGYDEVTGEVFTPEELGDMLNSRFEAGITQAKDIAVGIEESRGDSPKIKLERSKALGASLAHASLIAAAIAGQVDDRQHGNVFDMQMALWVAGETMKEEVAVIAKRTGAIPSLAQLANNQSPLRRDMVDNPGLLISKKTHEMLDVEIDVRGRF